VEERRRYEDAGHRRELRRVEKQRKGLASAAQE
jgi:hypothetical protein